ncbi:MAG TPA: hypothetical protein PLE79_05190 [Clostridia bacterium]|nr:MAG: hypothetical protein BWY62_00597 [Firmicutes bacterium ADurb.Bin356]HOF94913.1 hypothetical protein [Clostridia bacterium]
MGSEQAANKGFLAKLARRLKSDKRLELAVYGGLVLLILVLYLSTLLPKEEKIKTIPDSLNAPEPLALSEQDVERRLEKVLSSIRGAGTVRVMITYESGPELVTAMSTDTNSNIAENVEAGRQSTTEQQTESKRPATVTGSGGTTPIVLTEKQPNVRGVIVVAEGAADIAVRLNLQRAVQTVLSIPASSIEVFELEKPEK